MCRGAASAAQAVGVSLGVLGCVGGWGGVTHQVRWGWGIRLKCAREFFGVPRQVGWGLGFSVLWSFLELHTRWGGV